MNAGLSLLVCLVYAFTGLIGLIQSSTTADPDPCKSARELPFLRQREVGYTLEADEYPICDQYFREGWYEMYDYVIASVEEGCGTQYNWYRTDDLPDDDHIQKTTYCLSIGGGKCGLTREGLVKRCNEMKYVFKLVPLPSCSQAYCIEKLNGTNKTDTSSPDISEITPSVSYKVEMVNANNELHFFCNFTPSAGTDFFYAVEWGITTGYSWTDLLLTTNPLRYEKHEEFMKKTSLTESILKFKGFGKLGITIGCLIKAKKSPTGELSNARFSNPKFCGIQVLDKRVYLDATNADKATIRLQLTVPFGCFFFESSGCSIDVTMFIPQNTDKCKPSSLSQADEVDRVDNRCGVRISNTDIMTEKTIALSTIIGQNMELRTWKFTLILATQKSFEQHSLFQNYVLDTVEVDVATDMTKINGKWCRSQNDPHMTTFDNVGYENQNKGTFLLYRNKAHNVQVQMKTTRCSANSKVWCNCGVAVNAGRDVFILNKCPNGSPNWHPIFRCQDRILSRSVKGEQSGRKFVVYLPTGTEVHISLSYTLLNIYIKPSLSDWGNTDGLCGLFNGNINDDRVKRPGSTQSDINLSWNLEDDEENLFDAKNDGKLTTWSREMMLCHCHHIFEAGPAPNSSLQCRPDMSKKCTDNHEVFFEDRCSYASKKRSIHDNYSLDLYHNTNTNFDSTSTTGSKSKLIIKNKRMVYDSVTAKEDCLQVLNTTAFQMCSEVPELEVDKFVEECVLDAVATNSMEWALSHLDALKDQCLYEVKINQPLTEEDLEGTNSSVPEFSSNSTDNTKPPSTVYTKEFLEDLENHACLDDCNGNGRCQNGDCICHSGFIGADCSVKSSDPPVMTGIPDGGECDLQYRACAKTSVFGMNFISSTNLICSLVPFKVSQDMGISTEQSFTSNARLETFVEVSCSLLNERMKRSTDHNSKDYIAKGFKVSVSNNGLIFSEEDILVIFDSECVNCTKENGKIICTQKPGYCVKEGQCYRFGEVSGCYTCLGDMNKKLEWTSGSDCPMPDPILTEQEDKKLWIIPTAIVPVLLFVISVSIIWYWKIKRAAVKNKLTTSLSDLPQMRADQVQKKVYGV